MPLEFEKQKPQPLMLGDKAHYTLSSYDPVEVVVDIPFTTDEDVTFALATVLERMGATRENLSDSAWLAEHFQGITSQEELVTVIRAQITDMNAQVAEQQKVGLAVEKLTERLQQAIPTMLLARYRQAVEMRFQQQLAAEGMTVDQFMANSGASRADINEMLDAQATQVAEQEAALDAYAREKKLAVSEDEYGPLLGIPASDIEGVIKQAKGSGQFEQLKDAALHAKAAQAVAAECSCTYHHETEAEAHERIERVMRMREEYERGFGKEEEDDKGSGFQLV